MNDPLERHLDTWMKQFAATDEREHILPDPSVIWLKARVLQSAKAMERASLPITTAQIGAYIAVAACWALLLTSKWSAIQAWLDTFSPSHLFTGQQAASLSMPVLLTCVALGSVTVMIAMHAIFAEE